ncbi:MAG: hypothetical protein MRY63_05585 [Neomegalonema sp.]|nr:hypothetical protein [Neomegalonema sp.]
MTDHIVQDLGKKRELTSVLVESTVAAHWEIGGIARASAAHLEVCVTAGTNSDAEKRRFIANAMESLRNALPGVSEATYVVIRELPGSSWGYDGRTQADRAK